MPSGCRNQRKRTGIAVTERKPSEGYRRKENAGGTRSCAPRLRSVICRELARDLVCTQGVRGSNPLVSTNPSLSVLYRTFRISGGSEPLTPRGCGGALAPPGGKEGSEQRAKCPWYRAISFASDPGDLVPRRRERSDRRIRGSNPSSPPVLTRVVGSGLESVLSGRSRRSPPFLPLDDDAVRLGYPVRVKLVFPSAVGARPAALQGS